MEYFFLFWLFTFSICILIGDDAARKYVVPFFLVALSLYFGFRDGYGTDYASYIGMSDILRYQPDLHYVGGETGFRWLIILFNNLGLPSNAIVVVSFVISIACLSFAAYRISPSVTLSFIVILGFGFLFASFNLIRQALAFSIICAMLTLVRDEKYLSFSISVVVVALLFHKTAMLFAILPLFRFISYSTKTWLVILFSSILLIRVNTQIFEMFEGVLSVDWFTYSHYFATEWALASRNRTYLNLIIQLIIAVWIVTRVDWFNRNTFNRVLFNTYMIGFCVQVIFIDIQAFNRLSLLYTWLSFLVIPMAIMSYRNKNNRVLTTGGLISYTLVISWVAINLHVEQFNIGNHLFY